MIDESPAIPYDWARIECPTCGAQPDQRCRAKSGRTTDAHAKRNRDGRSLINCRREYDKYGCHCATPGRTGYERRYGLSAHAIRFGGTDYPHDPSDLCRCLYVSPSAPTHMRSRSRIWSVLVDHWDELAALLRQEHRDGRAPKTYARMQQLFREAS